MIKELISTATIDGETPFWVACKYGYLESVQLLLNHKRVDVNRVDKRGQRPIYLVCLLGHIEIVKLLLNNHRVDINKANAGGWTPFFIAFIRGYLEIMEHILASQNDVDLAIESTGGKRALVIDIARKRANEEKASWEGEEECQKRKRDCSKIVELLESFERNPIEKRFKLRLKLGLAGKIQFDFI